MTAADPDDRPVLDARDLGEFFGAALGGSEPGSGPAAPVGTGVDGSGTAVVDVPADRWHEAAALARDALGLTFLDWLSAVDETDREPPGFDIVLHVADPRRITRRLLLRTRVTATGAGVPELASVTGLWPGAAWHERETHEMFGVFFTGFGDGAGPLRPLLLPEGFEGTPLRKSFVLAARAAKPWPGAKEPGESEASAPRRRRVSPPGVPGPEWGPRETVAESATTGGSEPAGRQSPGSADAPGPGPGR